MWTGTESLSAHIRDQRTANGRRQAAYNRWHALGEDETRKDTQDINHHHHHHPSSFHCDSEKCHFAASSLALPILRAPLVADASHAHYRYHSLGTSIQHKSSSSSLGTHPSPHPLSSHCVRALSTPQSGPPVLQLRFCLRALSTRYRCTYVSQSSPALPCPALPFDVLVLETLHPCSLCPSDLTPPG